MTTLVIHAPGWKVHQEDARSFEHVFACGIGDGYAIPERLASKLYVGCDVVLLSKDEWKQAEGRLQELVPTSKTNSGMQRFVLRIWKECRTKLSPLPGPELLSWSKKRNRSGALYLP